MSTAVRRAVRRAALEAWLSQADEVLAASGPTADHAGAHEARTEPAPPPGPFR